MKRFSTSLLLMHDRGQSEISLIEATLALGLDVECKDLDTARRLLGGFSIADVLHADTPPNDIVQAWDTLMRSMASRDHNDSLPTLVALAAMANLFIHGTARLSSAIASRGWNMDRTASEAAMRLFGTEFNMGRKLVTDRHRRRVGRALLVESVATSSHVSPQFHNVNAKQRYHGMRGVAYLLLARGEFSPSKLALLEAASVDLAASRRLGDRSAQHCEYEVEVLLRRNQIEPSMALLNEADARLKMSGIVSRRLAYNAGDIYLARGIQSMAEGQYKGALAEFRCAVDAYSSGLQIVRRHRDMEDGEIRAKRGYARLRAYYAATKLTLTTPADELDGIVNDLECGKIDVDSGLSALPEALLWRAHHRRSAGDLDRAIQDLRRAIEFSPLSSKVPEVSDVLARLQCQLAECNLEQALRGQETPAVDAALRQLLAIDAEADPSIPLIANGVRRIVLDHDYRREAPLIREAALKMRTLMTRPHCVGASRAFAASYTAGVLHRLGDLMNVAELRKVCELYTEAIEGSHQEPGSEILALAAEAKIRLARTLLASGISLEESRQLLEDAIELLQMSLAAGPSASGAFSEQVAHSKLGEAFFRLGSLTGEVEHAEAAAKHFERSRILGNDAPELLGLLGGCYYRIGRAKKDVAKLRRAAFFKESARGRADERPEHQVSLRENWSVSSRIEEAIWQHTGDRTSLRAAINAGLRAHLADPKWPWPVFQLAAMRRSHRDEFNAFSSFSESLEGIDSRFEQALRRGTVEALEEFGAELCVQTGEFRRRILGGRTQVYILDDPHGLLSGTIVLKRNTKLNAEREAKDARSFSEFLRSCNADPLFSVARPLAVVPLGHSEAVYAMQHVKGRELGAFVVRGHHSGRPPFSNLFERVIDFLAWFHAWSWDIGIGNGPKPPTELRIVADSISTMWKQAGIREEDAERLCSLLTGILPAWAVNLRKKDAHPENWLVTPTGGLVLIDLESTRHLPALYDFCQLIDDYPAITVDEEGMQKRKDLLALYHQCVIERIPTIGKDRLVEGDPWAVACSFILFRAAFGFARLVLRSRGIGVATTSSALRLATLRREHYLKLIDWFARGNSSSRIAECAQHLSMMIKHLNLTN